MKFIKNSNINVNRIFGKQTRKDYILWLRTFAPALAAYNRTEKLLIFCIYYLGLTRRETIDITGITKYKYDLFFLHFKTCDTFTIVSVKNKYEV